MPDQYACRRASENEDGHILLGAYLNGLGSASWRLYSESSMWGGMVIGATGTGGLSLLEAIGLYALYRADTHVIHLDGQDGASCPDLWQAAHKSYRSDQVDEVLLRLAAVQKYRQDTRPPGPAGFTPTREIQGVLAIVSEAHHVVDDSNVDRWASLAGDPRSGVAIIMGDHDGSLRTFKKDTLRSALKSGNCVGLRTEDRSHGRILCNMPFNLYDLPATPRLACTFGDYAPFDLFTPAWQPPRTGAV